MLRHTTPHPHPALRATLSRWERENQSIQPVIWSFLRNRHIMHMRLADSGTGHAHEMRFAVHLVDARAADVTHRRAQAADELMHDIAKRSAIRHSTFDAF